MLAGSSSEHREPKATDPVDLEESGSSGDEYVPAVSPAYKDDGESEVDGSDSEVDAGVEDKDEENKPKKGKKLKPARADIIAKRNMGSASSQTSTARTEAKRKLEINNEYVSSFTRYDSLVTDSIVVDFPKKR
jgi:hypothetical protein